MIPSIKAATFSGHSSSAKAKPKTLVAQGLKKLAKAVKDLSLIGPVIQLIFTLKAEESVRRQFGEESQKLSPQAKLRLAEMEKRVQDIAKKAGIANPQRFKVFVGPAASPFKAFPRYTLLIPVECLLKPEDLPADLSLDKLNQKVMDKREWTDRCYQWLNQSFAPQKEKSPDRRLDYLFHLHVAHSAKFASLDEALIVHELGHCALDHVRKAAWQRFAWQLLAIPTLGISTLFEKRVMRKVSLKYENEADVFSAQKVNGADSLITYWSAQLFLGRIFHQTDPELWDAKGNYIKDRSHPLMTARIEYLRPFAKQSISDDRGARFLKSLA